MVQVLKNISIFKKN